MKWPFVLRSTAEKEMLRAYELGEIAGRNKILERKTLEQFSLTEKFIDDNDKTPITEGWKVEAKYVSLMDQHRRSVYVGKIGPTVFQPGDVLNIHFNIKDAV